MFRVTPRESLVLTAAFALALVSLKYASAPWEGIVGVIAMLTATIAVVTSVFDRGRQRAFAIGFAVVMIGYALLVLNVQRFVEGVPKDSVRIEIGGSTKTVELKHQLPTSYLLYLLHSTLNGPEEMADFVLERVPSNEYMIIGHFWWAMLFGYIGGRVAGSAFVRRTSNHKPATSETEGGTCQNDRPSATVPHPNPPASATLAVAARSPFSSASR